MELDLGLVGLSVTAGFDALILGLLYKSYSSCSSYIQALKVYAAIITINSYLITFNGLVLLFNQEAEQVDISHLGRVSTPKIQHRSWYKFWQSRNSKSVVDSGIDNDCRYVCLRGIVEPVDKSRLLYSTDNKSTGVIHKIVTKEVATVRNGTRFW